MKILKNIKSGKNSYLILLFFLFLKSNLYSENNIITPLINVDQIKPSYEEVQPQENEKVRKKSRNLMNEIKSLEDNKEYSGVKIIGLDKITAKTSEFVIKIGEKKNYGLLEIKPLKCGKVIKENFETEDVAYLQIKDRKESENEKVFIFNGWTFSSNSINTSIDHAIYDVWLISCTNT